MPNAACRPDARPRQRTQERRQGIGGKPTDSTRRNDVCFVRQSVTSPDRAAAAPPKAARRNLFDTSALFARMSATLANQFERFAECCLKLARSAETTERRARFIQMAHEYRLATLLTSQEPSSGPKKGRRLLPAAESPLLIAAVVPASRAQTRPQSRLFARSAAPRHPGFKAQMFDADKQNRDLSNRDQGGNTEGPDT